MLATTTGFVDAIADFGDDRRDVYKIYVRAGETLRVRTEALPLGGNLGLDVGIFPPGATHLASSLKGALDERAIGLGERARCARNSTRRTASLVQASSRRGWGAYRLRWIVSPPRV